MLLLLGLLLTVLTVSAGYAGENKEADYAGNGDVREYGPQPPLTNVPSPPPPLPPQPQEHRGVVNPRTGEYLTPSGEGLRNPRTGDFYLPSSNGYYNPRTGEFVPRKP
ncbi:MAG: hypothetical protein HQL09_03250 [Nitrospirae bacterium]|nr:hypothetical protein [Nitrospirota bacterium]